MKTGQTVEFKPETVAEAYLALLATRDVDYLFGNSGTDFPPLVEALAKGRNLGWQMPEPIIVPHENVGVAMAHGYYMVTGRPQAMMVHVGLGTANSINGLFNASRQNIPVLFTAGRTPITEGGLLGSRNNYINWAQEQFDQGGMLREFVKWDYELRHPSQIESVVDRALAIAKSEPCGPVYLTLPREVLASALGETKIGKRTTIAPMSPPSADPDTLDEVAKLLGNAKNPMVITANGGRTPETAQALTRLAETWAIPVIQYRPRYLALPTEHPMFCGFDPHAMLPEADLILVVDCDVPWIPDTAKISPECKIVHIGVDPLFSRYPVRGFRTDIALAGSLAPTLDLLNEKTERYAGSATKIAARRAAVSQQSADYRLRMRMGPGATQTSGQISVKWMTHCINAVADENTIIVNEYPLVLEELTINQPGRYFSHPPSGGLGWGMGAALGAKLGRPDATVICAIGDGAYMFGNPTPAHFIGEAHGLPVLYVINNNARWGAVHRATLGMYPKGHAAGADKPPFSVLEPSPRFEEIVRASGGYGERVEDPNEMLPALKRALNAVKNEKRQAVLNVCTEVSYARTS